jgi:hypothetical protein
VEPVFCKRRPGHARCVSCASAANSTFRLQPLAQRARRRRDVFHSSEEFPPAKIRRGDGIFEVILGTTLS